MNDLDAILGDWRGAGYSEEEAARLARRVNEIVAEELAAFDEPSASDANALWPGALERATREIPPDLIASRMTSKPRRPAMNRRRYLVEIATGDYGSQESRAVLPRVSARRLAKRRIWDTSPVSRYQGVGVTAPGGFDEMPYLLGWYRNEIRKQWDRTSAI